MITSLPGSKKTNFKHHIYLKQSFKILFVFLISKSKFEIQNLNFQFFKFFVKNEKWQSKVITTSIFR